ncbi:MAG: poly-gamma-glutamate biosynthesis protein PgsC [Candidatus Atribacteria bacterium]|nr:poly-gamma-glutamate biosynthesis protein PgsC [Candidatus Atribacteria bacterium]
MIFQAIGIGIIIGFLFYEVVGLSPGGIVVPGYLALFIDQPGRIVLTIGIALLTYYTVLFLSNHLILYGKRRFLSMVLISFIVKWLVEGFLFQLPIVNVEIQSIGYIIPGLLANEMRRQGVCPTLLATAIVTILVRLTLYLLRF